MGRPDFNYFTVTMGHAFRYQLPVLIQQLGGSMYTVGWDPSMMHVVVECGFPQPMTARDVQSILFAAIPGPSIMVNPSC